MVTEVIRQGLIVTTREQTTDPLNELIVRCGWPVLLAANPRLMRQQLELLGPEWLLFWLDEYHAVAATANLIAWVRERGPRPYRIVVAYRLEADVEPALRAVGVQSYLTVVDDVGTAVETALWPLLELVEQQRLDPAAMPPVAAAAPAHRAPLTLGTFPELGRPP